MYKDKEPKELLELVNKHKSLTFKSQMLLNDELKNRGLSLPKDELVETINEKKLKIINLEYLSNLGFRIERNVNSLKIIRTTQAIIIDLSAIFFGVVFLFYAARGLVKLSVAINEGTEFGLTGIISLIIYLAIGRLGIKFLSGIKRFLDYLGFELSKNNAEITLRKRFDLKLEEIKSDIKYLNLERNKDKIILKLGEQDLIISNANNIVQKMTIESLYNELRKNSN